MNINTLEELYKRVMPALELKQNELKKDGKIISTEDIFNILKEKKWTKSKNLKLFDVVNDILKFTI